MCLFCDKCVHIDQLNNLFEETFGNDAPALNVVQDLWHAKMRVVRKMNRYSKSYNQAVHELNELFSRFKKSSMHNDGKCWLTLISFIKDKLIFHKVLFCNLSIC